MDLKVNTAGYITFGPVRNVSDGVTPVTDASLINIYLSKNGGIFTARNSSIAIVHDRDGFFRVYLDATDRNTLGNLRVQATNEAEFITVWEDYKVISSYDYSAIFVSGAGLIDSSSPFLFKLDYDNLLPAEQAAIDALILCTTELIQKYCNRIFLAADYEDEIRWGTDENSIFVKNIPLNSISRVKLKPTYQADSISYDSGIFNFNSRTGEVWCYQRSQLQTNVDQTNFINYFPEGNGNILISYNGGFTTIPIPIQELCADMVLQSFSPEDVPGILEAEKLGQYFYKTKKGLMEQSLLNSRNILSMYKIRKV